MVAVSIFGLIAAAGFLVAGLNMLGLRSVAGNTVNEAFDQAMGVFSLGMSAFVVFGILAVNHLSSLLQPSGHEEEGWKTCVECLEPVREMATKCPHCGSDLLGEPDAEDELHKAQES